MVHLGRRTGNKGRHRDLGVESKVKRPTSTRSELEGLCRAAEEGEDHFVFGKWDCQFGENDDFRHQRVGGAITPG